MAEEPELFIYMLALLGTSVGLVLLVRKMAREEAERLEREERER